MGRRHCLPFDNEVSLRPRPFVGRGRRRKRSVRLVAGRPLPFLDRTGAGLSRSQILREFRRFRVYDKGAGGGTARFRPDLVADERVPDDHRRRNAAPAHGPACRERQKGRRISRATPKSRLGVLCRAGEQPLLPAGAKIYAKGGGRGLHLWGQGRLRGRDQTGGERRAVLASGEYRRYAQPDPATGLGGVPALVGRETSGGRRWAVWR